MRALVKMREANNFEIVNVGDIYDKRLDVFCLKRAPAVAKSTLPRRYIVDGSGTEFIKVMVGAEIETGFPTDGGRDGSLPYTLKTAPLEPRPAVRK
jgi:hypothetical protein